MIGEAYLIVISVISALALGAGVYFWATQLGDAFRTASQDVVEKARVKVNALFAFAANGSDTAKLWVKNTGKEAILAGEIERGDLFFGPRGSFSRIPYGGSQPPTWSFVIANDDGDNVWEPGETVEITITLSSPLSSGDYFARYTTHTGYSTDIVFTVG